MTRSTVVLVVVLAAVAAIVLLAIGSEPYKINARFENAGQLVEGGEVQVAGRRVGSISKITLSDEGEANVEVSIDDEAITPLHEGTRASIRAVGQAGVTNRFVDLSPGPPDSSEIADGGVLPTTQTAGIVDLDALLDAFGPAQRRDLAALIENSAQVFAGSGSRRFNSMLAELDPALGEVQTMMGELSYDDHALARLIRTGSTAAGAVAARSEDLKGAVVNAARTFSAISRERKALGDVLERSPAVFEQATGTLRRTAEAVTAVRPALRAVQPASAPLSGLLAELAPMLRRARPVLAHAADVEPRLGRALTALAQIGEPGADALRSLAPALKGAQPLLEGARYYAPDFLLGVTNGLAGLLSANYNASGHYARLTFLQSLETTVSGLPSLLLDGLPIVPGLLDVRTGLTAPCPGSAHPPAPDHSNPWVPDPTLCNPDDSVPESVLDFP